jgi:endonuclease/exonuclease/phosphatase family metal-dependent hydrolase
MLVLSWNLWWRFGGNWREREVAITKTLHTFQPDIAGLQEVWATDETSQAEVLGRRLGLYAAYAGPSFPPPPALSPDHMGVDLGVGVLSRWPIVRTRPVALPSRDRHDPVALVATADHPDGPLHVVVACVEWEAAPAFAEQRRAQTQVLSEVLADPELDGPLPVLLTADLNAPPQAPEIATLREVAVDTWTAGASRGAGHTHSSDNPFAERTSWLLDQRIDYIMARPGYPCGPVSVTTSFIAGDPVNGCHPSDHFAVVTELRP